MGAQSKHAGVSTSTVHLPNGTMRKQLGGFHFAGTEAAIFKATLESRMKWIGFLDQTIDKWQ